MSLLGLSRWVAVEAAEAERRAGLRDAAARRAQAEALPERPVHWPWLHGPVQAPDPQPDPGLVVHHMRERTA